MYDNIPEPKPERGSVRERFVSRHTEENESLVDQIDDVRVSHFVTQASGEDLDRIGERFGLLGQRLGRNDKAYRQYIQSILQSYSGRGTVPGLKQAIAASVRTTSDNVELIEDFDNLQYEIVLSDWNDHETETLIEVADLADPSVVERRSPLHYTIEETNIEIGTQETLIESINSVVDTASVTVSPSNTKQATVAAGLGSHFIGKGNTLGDGI